jgi:hypothetical protein
MKMERERAINAVAAMMHPGAMRMRVLACFCADAYHGFA